MVEVIEALRIRRVQRVPYHFTQSDLGTSTTYAAMTVLNGDVTKYIVPRNGHIIDVTVMVNAAITTSGWRFQVLVNDSQVGDDYEITSTDYTRVHSSSSEYYVSTRINYGKAFSDTQVDEYSTLSVQWRAIVGSAAPSTIDAMVVVTVAQTGED